MNTRTRGALAALITSSAAVMLLAGCSQNSGPAPERSPQSTKTPTGFEKQPYENACDGNQAIISGDGDERTLPKGCAAVSITSKGSSITVGDTETVVVEGSNNEITVKTADSVTFLGSNNTLHVEQGKPEVTDHGHGNSVD